MLLHRVLTALVGVPIVLAAIWFGPPWLTILAAVVAAVGVWEAYRLYPPLDPNDDGEPPAPLPAWLGGTWAVALVLAGEMAVGPADFGIAVGVICIIGCIGSGLWMIAAWDGRSVAAAALYLVLPPVYVGGALACAVALRGAAGPALKLSAVEMTELGEWGTSLNAGEGVFAEIPWLVTDYGGWWVLLGILTVYAADTGAYAVGRLIGRHPMSPGISPGKTWEGTAGGLAGAVIAAVALGLLFQVGAAIWHLAGIGVILGCVSPAGDLLESKIKRLANVKDSGNLFPGHGGMLDRLDSLLPSLTVLYILVAVSTVIP